MKFKSSILFIIFICSINSFLCFVPLNKINDDLVLYAPKEKPIGLWGQWEECKKGTLVTGVTLKMQTELDEDKNDDFGISGIELLCGRAGDLSNQTIYSSMAREGQWAKRTFHCDGYIQGFQLKIDTIGKGKDYAGITNMYLFCSGGKQVYKPETESVLGKWTEPQLCRKAQAVCGIQTSTKNPNERDDLVGINSLKMLCCEIPNQTINCFPYDKWELVYEIDNRHGFVPISYTYTKSIGMSKKDGTKNTGKGSAQGDVLEMYDQQNKRDRKRNRNRPPQFLPNPVQPPPSEPDEPQQVEDDRIKNKLHGNPSYSSQSPPQKKIRNRKRINRQKRHKIMNKEKAKNTFLREVIPNLFSSEEDEELSYEETLNKYPKEENIFYGRQESTSILPSGQEIVSSVPGGVVTILADPNRSQNSNIAWFYTQSLKVSKNTGFNWEKASDKTFAPMKSTYVEIKVAPGHYIALYQVVGICGDYFVRPEKFYQNGSYYDPEQGRREISVNEWRGLSKFTRIFENVSSMYQRFFNIGKVFNFI